MSTLFDLIKEYALIGYFKILPFVHKTTPDAWNHGDKGDVVLIPGLHETAFSLLKVGNVLNVLGYRIHTIPDFSSIAPVQKIHERLENVVKSLDGEEIILVSHSKGGVVARYFLTQSPLADRVKSAVTISAPHHGSLFGKLQYHNLHELDHNSEVLMTINDSPDHAKKIINIYPRLDNHVLPNRNLLLDGAKNIEIDIVGHTRILASDKLFDELIRVLK
ncbi:hypothetical protein KC614_04750 [candidate division WWE3 bacterium]|uniref:GPI inositol-deacylase PGAP1-like alpha/beta domain-containing protein n=1 Tax=candidate division WWE3 bacterium TaxID=2053526 RepID=A0A955RSD3_UNCKA|nr:hypothetical protein [candidate division WWE3 bacterium]